VLVRIPLGLPRRNKTTRESFSNGNKNGGM
jgi:hypothetical protein